MHALKKSIPLGVLLALAGGPMPALAEPEAMPVRGPIPFATYDKDGNGFVSEEEFYTARGERMAARAAEGRPMRGAGSAPAFADYDADGDGRLTPDELAAGQRAQAQGRRGGGMGRGRGMRGGTGANLPTFADYDLDGDGAIVEQEFYEARSRRIAERAKQGYRMKNLGNAPGFADIDTDGDGSISADEFAAHQARHRGRRTR